MKVSKTVIIVLQEIKGEFVSKEEEPYISNENT